MLITNVGTQKTHRFNWNFLSEFLQTNVYKSYL